MRAHITVDRNGNKRYVYPPTPVFFFKCGECGQPLHEEHNGLRLGTTKSHFCKACDIETNHTLVKEIHRR